MEKTISVICVDASGKNDLVVGNIYEVTDAGPTIYKIVSGLPKDFTGERFFFKSRFQEVGVLLKVGDKVRLRAGITNTTQLEWIGSDNIKNGIVYEVSTTSPHGGIRVVPKDGARGIYRIKMDCFELVTEEKKVVRPTHNEICLATFKKGDRVRFLASKTPDSFYKSANHFTKQAGLKPTGIYTVCGVGIKNSGDANSGSAYISLEGYEFCHPYDCFELVKEEPKPVETKKPRLMLCINMAGNSLARYTVGKVYKLRTEDNDYYYFKASDDGPGGGGMFKHRFIEIKDEVANSVKVLCTNNAAVMDDLLTVGKTYEAVPSKDGEEFWTIPVSDKGTSATAYKHRFTVLTEETTVPKEEPISKYFNIGDQFKASSEIVYLVKQKINSELVQIEWQSPCKPMGTLSTMKFTINQVSDHFAAGRWVKIEKRGFKVGDTVICKSESYSNMLVQGKSYVIVEMDIDNFVKVSSLDGGYFIDYWFKLDRFI